MTKPKITQASVVKADMDAARAALSELKNLRREMASEVGAALSAFSGADLCKELAARLNEGEVEAESAEFNKVLDAAELTKEQVKEQVTRAGWTPDDFWPAEYVLCNEVAVNDGQLIRAAAAVVYDFDLNALRDLEHTLARLHVFGRCAAQADGADMRLLLNPGPNL